MCCTMGRVWGLMGWGDSTTLDNLKLTAAARGPFSDLIPFWLTHPIDFEYTTQWITVETSMHNVAKTWKPKSCTDETIIRMVTQHPISAGCVQESLNPRGPIIICQMLIFLTSKGWLVTAIPKLQICFLKKN